MLQVKEAVAAQQDADLQVSLDAQKEAGLDYFSDGLLNWQDIFRAPAVEMKRSKPVELSGEPFIRIGDLPRRRGVMTLPSPHALAERAIGEVEPQAVAAGMLGPQIRWLAGNGCPYTILQESALVGKRSDLYGLSEALEALASPLPFRNAGDVLGELSEALGPACIEVDADCGLRTRTGRYAMRSSRTWSRVRLAEAALNGC